jgi:uncharacterized protein
MRLSVPLHYCSSRFKDGVQLRQRLLRRAERVAPPFAVQTEDGTLLLGIVEIPAGEPLDRLVARVARLGHLRAADYRVDVGRRRIELQPARLRKWAGRLKAPAFVVEEYPTADALEVEREPLNEAALSPVLGGGGT